MASEPTFVDQEGEGTLSDTRAEPGSAPFGLGRWGPYEVLELLGAGGMGTVYRALDRRLDREVALKFIGGRERASTDAAQTLAVARFQREARAQARVDHEGVCKVYEVGELNGRPYIAMQLVRGRPLSELAASLGSEEKVAILRDICLAVQEAHRLGIIHRDLKPANVLVEQTEDGRWRPVVLDFGLARELGGGADLSETGSVLGTPAYMAPEAARGAGRALDRRADVYALGAMLYALIAGRPPHQGDNAVDVLLSVLERDAAPLRAVAPGCPPDLDWIAARCLERDPARRYPSARALADDLGRYLDGEPVSTAAGSGLAALRRVLRRHRARVGAGALVLFLLFLGGLTAWSLRASARRQLAFAEESTRQLEEMAGLLRRMRDLPLHDLSGDKARLRARIQAQVEALPSRPAELRGPALTAIGRSYLLLGDVDQARGALQQAWDQGYRERATRRALGAALAEGWRREAAALAGVGDAEERAQQQARLRAELLSPALALLTAPDPDGEDEGALERARLALYEGQLERAVALARQAAEEAPWEVDAVLIEAEARAQRAMAARDSTRYDEAEAEFQAAAALYARGVDMSRSDERLRLGAARLWPEWCELGDWSGRADPTLLDQAEAAASALVTVAPTDIEALEAAARIAFCDAHVAYLAGRDPSPGAARAAALLEHLPPGVTASGRLLDFAGGTQVRLALHQIRSGEDASAAVQAAVENLERAAQVDPGFSLTWQDLPGAYLTAAQWRAEQGASAHDQALLAIAASDRALQHGARALAVASDRLFTGAYGVQDATEFGLDPTPFLEDARRAVEAGGAQGRRNKSFAVNLAWVRLAESEHLATLGMDGWPALQAARDALGDPGAELLDEVEIRLLEASLALQRGRLLASRCEDPAEAVAEARGAFVSSDLELFDTRLILAKLSLLEARAGRPAGLQQGLAAAASAHEASPRSVRASELLAEVLLARGRAGQGTRAEDRARALALVDEVLARQPARPRSRALRALILSEQRAAGGAELEAALGATPNLRGLIALDLGSGDRACEPVGSNP